LNFTFYNFLNQLLKRKRKKNHISEAVKFAFTIVSASDATRTAYWLHCTCMCIYMYDYVFLQQQIHLLNWHNTTRSRH